MQRHGLLPKGAGVYTSPLQSLRFLPARVCRWKAFHRFHEMVSHPPLSSKHMLSTFDVYSVWAFALKMEGLALVSMLQYREVSSTMSILQNNSYGLCINPGSLQAIGPYIAEPSHASRRIVSAQEKWHTGSTESLKGSGPCLNLSLDHRPILVRSQMLHPDGIRAITACGCRPYLNSWG